MIYNKKLASFERDNVLYDIDATGGKNLDVWHAAARGG